MTKNIHIVADSKIPFLRGVLEPYAQISYYDPSEITNAVVRDADILLVLAHALTSDSSQVQNAALLAPQQ